MTRVRLVTDSPICYGIASYAPFMLGSRLDLAMIALERFRLQMRLIVPMFYQPLCVPLQPRNCCREVTGERKEETAIFLYRITLVVLASILIAEIEAPAGAQSSFIGTYRDESRSSWRTNGSSPYQIDVLFYATIVGDGILGYGFELIIPPNLDLVT